MSNTGGKKKNTILIAVVVVLAIITVWYFWSSRSPQGQVFSVDQLLNNETQFQGSTPYDNLPSSDIFTQSIEGDPRFKELKDHRETKLKIDKIGKDNPFEPFR